MVSFPAHFDGERLLPNEPVDLPVDKPLRVTVEEVATPYDGPPLNLADFFGAIETECGLIEGPEDLATQHDHYLYGAPKRSDGNGG
jgi:hypothetical protein